MEEGVLRGMLSVCDGQGSPSDSEDAGEEESKGDVLEAVAAQAPAAQWAVGDRVEVRDGDEDWRPGAVQSILDSQVVVKVDGWDNADAAKKEILKSVEAFEKK